MSESRLIVLRYRREWFSLYPSLYPQDVPIDEPLAVRSYRIRSLNDKAMKLKSN